MTNLMEGLLGDAEGSLAALTRIFDEAGFKYLQVQGILMGVGVGFPATDGHFAAISVGSPPNDRTAFITGGVLQDVQADRLAILNECNRRTQGNAAYPVSLHDAQDGWDVLLQQSYPVQLLTEVPQFFIVTLNGVLQTTLEVRDEFTTSGIAGRPYTWSEEDLTRLVQRSLL